MQYPLNGIVSSDFKPIAEGFNNYFINIGPSLSSDIPDMDVSPSQFLNNTPSPLNSLFLAPTDHDEVIKICSSLKSGASPGYDDIKPDAKVVPVYKSGDSDSCNNYRPISVLPVFSKVFERIIHKRLHNFFTRYD